MNWPEEQVNRSHSETTEPETSKSETSDFQKEEMADDNFDDNPLISLVIS